IFGVFALLNLPLSGKDFVVIDQICFGLYGGEIITTDWIDKYSFHMRNTETGEYYGIITEIKFISKNVLEGMHNEGYSVQVIAYQIVAGYYDYTIPPFMLPHKIASPEERGKWPLIAAAIRCGDTVYAGLRHNVPYKYLLGFPDKRDILDAMDTEDREGFVDMNGCFYNRWQSARVANWQIQTDKMQDLLISEDLWHDDFTPKHGPWRERIYV